MKDENYFEDFKSLCINILAESDNCLDSQDAFRKATTVQQLVGAWQKFWAGVIHEVPEQVKTAFARLYSVYKDDINRAGLWYNEQPQTGGMRALVLIGDVPAGSALDDVKPVTISGNHRVYVIGDQPVNIAGSCRATISAEITNVDVYDIVNVNIEKGRVSAHGRATVNGRGDITSYDSTTINIDGGTLHDHGHLHVVAYNNANIDGFTSRRVTLYDKSQLVIRRHDA